MGPGNYKSLCSITVWKNEEAIPAEGPAMLQDLKSCWGQEAWKENTSGTIEACAKALRSELVQHNGGMDERLCSQNVETEAWLETSLGEETGELHI